MAGKSIELGSTGRTVAENIRRLRGARTYTELSKRLAECGREIPPLGIRRIEDGTRRVDVDDLTAFAVALGVSPTTLLAPDSEEADEQVNSTGLAKPITAIELWRWLTVIASLPPYPASPVKFFARALPAWRLNKLIVDSTGTLDPMAHRQLLARGSNGDD